MIFKKLLKPVILAICVVVLVIVALRTSTDRDPLDYNAHLSDTAVTIDGNAVTFEDLAFYILFEERKVEEQAKIYNPDYTKDYWNLHTNDTFIQSEAKEVVIGMAIHDHLFYELALEDGMDTLTDDEEKELEGAITDFWEDLLDVQWTKLPCDEDTINNQIRIAAVAEKFGNYLATDRDTSVAAYKYDGYYYSQILDEHDVKINHKLWDRLVMGDITLTHTKINYINGLTDADKEKDKEEKGNLSDD